MDGNNKLDNVSLVTYCDTGFSNLEPEASRSDEDFQTSYAANTWTFEPYDVRKVLN